MPSIYQRIISDLTQAIESGYYPPSHKLPSVRQLSKTYGCSKDTVQKALLELKYRHYLYALPKSGYYVLEDRQSDKEEIALPSAELALTAYEDFRLCLNETLNGRESYLFNYYDQEEGLRDLIRSVHQLLYDSHVYSKQDQLAITSGTQQALYSLLQMPFPNGKTDILLEQPTYHRMNDLVKNLSLPVVTIDRTFEGLDLTEVEQLFQSRPIKFFYTMPRCHQPLGTSYSDKEKAALVELAKRYDVYLIEDDYMADLIPGQSAPIHYFDTDQRVIYIKSFSASIFPSLRLAAVVLPSLLKKAFLKTKSLMDYDTNLIMQKALSLYLDNGMFDKNRKQRRQLYQEEEATIMALLSPYTFPCPYRLSHQALILGHDAFSSLPRNLQKMAERLDKAYLAPPKIAYYHLDLSQAQTIAEVIEWLDSKT